MLSLFQSISLVLTIMFLTYVSLILVPYLRRKPAPPGDPSAFEWHAFIPCRDEESVIGDTIDRARSTFPGMHLWVIDDDSEDATSEIVRSRAAVDPLVHLVQRRRPEARTGKGDALNAAYRELLSWLPEGTQRDKVIVVVVDADGELAPTALGAASTPEIFGNPKVGAAQLTVYMKNRDDRRPLPERGAAANFFARWLLRMQDVEFRTTILAMQSLRAHTGTVGMGGNGQFTRLSVLEAISQESGTPWHGALLEDFELGLHVIFAGYENRQVHDSYVSQEALPDVPRLITQRARWAQGVMQCVKYMGTIFRSPNFSAAGALEAVYFLILPFLQVAGAIVFGVVAGSQAAVLITDPGVRQYWLDSIWMLGIIAVVFGIAPFGIWGIVYKLRCEPGISWPAAFGIGISNWIYQAYVIVSISKALYRLIRGRNGWAKTRRNADRPTAGSIAIES